VKRNDLVVSMPLARSTHVSNDDAHPAAGDEDAVALPPNLVHLVQESRVVVEPSELVLTGRVFNEVEVGRGSQDEMDGSVLNCRQVSRIAPEDPVTRLEGVRRHQRVMLGELLGDGRLLSVEIDDAEALEVRVSQGRLRE